MGIEFVQNVTLKLKANYKQTGVKLTVRKMEKSLLTVSFTPVYVTFRIISRSLFLIPYSLLFLIPYFQPFYSPFLVLVTSDSASSVARIESNSLSLNVVQISTQCDSSSASLQFCLFVFVCFFFFTCYLFVELSFKCSVKRLKNC